MSLDLENLSPEWKDETSIAVLFAPFRSRNVNEKEYTFKLNFWRNSIEALCKHNKVCNFNITNLENSFYHKGRRPMCLNSVIEELIISKEIVTVDALLRTPPASWSGWFANVLITKPLSWSYNYFKRRILTDDHCKEYIFMKALEDESTNIYKSLLNNKYDLITLKDFRKLSDHNEDNLIIIVHYLVGKKLIVVKDIEINKCKHVLIRIAKDNNEIKDWEIDKYVLKQSENCLIETVSDLENSLVNLRNEAKYNLKNGQKHLAKNCLIKKKAFERRLENRSNALCNIQTLLSRLEDITEDKKVYNTYKTALSSLRTNLKDEELNEDTISNVMIEIGEMLDIHQDIQTTLSNPVNDDGISTEDLEKELNDLLLLDDENESNQKPNENNTSFPPKSKNDIELDDLEKEFMDLNLPSVPKDNISDSRQLLS